MNIRRIYNRFMPLVALVALFAWASLSSGEISTRVTLAGFGTIAIAHAATIGRARHALGAYTHISDIIVPAIWVPYTIQRSMELSELVQCGIIQNSPQFDELAAGGGNTVNMPHFEDLSGDDEVLSDSGALTPGKITTGQDVAVMLSRGKAWQHNDLAGILAGADPAEATATLVGSYWARRFQATTIALLDGIFSIASMSGLLHAIHATSGTADADNFLTGVTWIDACQLLGDAKSMLTGVIMHSAVEASLLKQDLIDFLPDSEGKPTIKVFQGKRVIIDDGMTVEVINSANVYSTYIFGQGALALGMATGLAEKPVEGGHGTWGLEFFRQALEGNSGMINRRKLILHPRGIKWLGASVAGASPTNAELATAANWVRVFDIKKIRVVKVTHNIAA